MGDAIANFWIGSKCFLGQGRWLSEAGNSLGDMDRHLEEEVKACFNRSGSEPGRKWRNRANRTESIFGPAVRKRPWSWDDLIFVSLLISVLASLTYTMTENWLVRVATSFLISSLVRSFLYPSELQGTWLMEATKTVYGHKNILPNLKDLKKMCYSEISNCLTSSYLPTCVLCILLFSCRRMDRISVYC